MTGKCFSITVNTLAWQVVDMTTRTYSHNVQLFDKASNTMIHLTIPSKLSSAYKTVEALAADIEEIGNVMCMSRTGTGACKAGIIFNMETKFVVWTDVRNNYTYNQLEITDSVS